MHQAAQAHDESIAKEQESTTALQASADSLSQRIGSLEDQAHAAEELAGEHAGSTSAELTRLQQEMQQLVGAAQQGAHWVVPR